MDGKGKDRRRSGVRDIRRAVARFPIDQHQVTGIDDQAHALAEKYSQLEVTTVEEKEMAELGMNAYLAVGRGSDHESVLTLMH